MLNRPRSISSLPFTLYLFPLIWMLLIFMVSGTPSHRIPKAGAWDTLIKKGSHLLAYALLTVLWLRPLSLRWAIRPAVGLALLITVLYAVSDEYHQTLVPGRHGSGVDVLVDTAGALLGLWVWRWRAKHCSQSIS